MTREDAERVVAKQHLPPDQVEAAIARVLMMSAPVVPARIPGATLPEQDELEASARLLQEERRELQQAQGLPVEPAASSAPALVTGQAAAPPQQVVPRAALEDMKLKPEDLLVFAALRALAVGGPAKRDLVEISRLSRQTADQVLASIEVLASGGYIEERIRILR